MAGTYSLGNMELALAEMNADYTTGEMDPRKATIYEEKVLPQRTAQRERETEKLLDAVDNAERHDLVFVLDCTSSMQPYVDECKEKIDTIYKNQIKSYPTGKIRTAFVGYRDFVCKPYPEILNFTNNCEDFYKALDTVKAEGGGDACEDVFQGFQDVSTLDWEYKTRSVHHFCDAPGHGRKYNSGCNDDHPDLEPDFVGELKKWSEKEISYYFYPIGEAAIPMFKQIQQDAPKTMRVSMIPFDDITAMMNTIKFSSTLEVQRNIVVETSKLNIKSATLSAFSKKTTDLKTEKFPESMKRAMVMDSRLDAVTEDVSRVEAEHDFIAFKAECFIQRLPEITSLESLINSVDNKTGAASLYKPDRKSQRNVLTCQKVIGTGANRVAYQATLRTLIANAETKEIVVKKFHKEMGTERNAPKRTSREIERSKEVYTHQAVTNQIAKFLANLFNESRSATNDDKDTKSIRFVDAFILQTAHNKNQIWNGEEMLPSFHKYTDNVGTVSHDTDCFLMEFSLYTCQVTKGKLMVVDLQGHFDEELQTYVLTDPVILCENIHVFGATNLGAQCMKKCVTALERRIAMDANEAGDSGVKFSYAEKSYKDLDLKRWCEKPATASRVYMSTKELHKPSSAPNSSHSTRTAAEFE